jgi:hypothetical protein
MPKIEATYIEPFEGRNGPDSFISYKKVHRMDDGCFFVEENQGRIYKMPRELDRHEDLKVLSRVTGFNHTN